MVFKFITDYALHSVHGILIINNTMKHFLHLSVKLITVSIQWDLVLEYTANFVLEQ